MGFVKIVRHSDFHKCRTPSMFKIFFLGYDSGTKWRCGECSMTWVLGSEWERARTW